MHRALAASGPSGLVAIFPREVGFGRAAASLQVYFGARSSTHIGIMFKASHFGFGWLRGADFKEPPSLIYMDTLPRTLGLGGGAFPP